MQNPNTTDLQYTRSGSFSANSQGFLVNAAGYYLQGWRLDENGNLPANRNELRPINLNILTGTASATTEMNLRANLRASIEPVGGYTVGDLNSGTVNSHFERTLEVFDSQGGAQPLRLAFVKTGANEWAYEVIYEGNANNIGGAGNNPVASGTLTFNPDGSIATPGTTDITIPWDLANSGLNPQTIAVNFGTPGQANGVTQFDSTSTLISSGVNGALMGGLSGVSVDETGIVTALFDNGVQRPVFKLPIATFQNPNGLTAASGNAYLRSDVSGDVTLLEANTGGAGSVAAAALEASTVDLAKEFTDLITTQRAYSASSRIITTADEMLDELIRIKR
jgi:flagellar hook protein FlgE